MSADQLIDLEGLVATINSISNKAKATVQAMNAAADGEGLSRDLVIQTYKQNSESHMQIIRRLQSAYVEISTREVARIRDKASRQKQTEHRNDDPAEPAATKLHACRKDRDQLKDNNAALQTKNEILKEKEARLKGNVEMLSARNSEIEEEAQNVRAQIASLQNEHVHTRNEKDRLSRENETLRQDNARLREYEAADWEGAFKKKETQYNSEVEINKGLRETIEGKQKTIDGLQKTNERLENTNERLEKADEERRNAIIHGKAKSEETTAIEPVQKGENTRGESLTLVQDRVRAIETEKKPKAQEHLTSPIGGLSDQNLAQGTPEENAALPQYQVHWKDALSITKAIVSTALAVAVMAQDHGAVEEAYLDEFAMRCTDFLFIIHSLCPDKSLRALKDKWPPKWLDADNEAEKQDWATFCSDVGYSLEDPARPLWNDAQPASKLKGSIEQRMDRCTPWKGTWLKPFVPMLLVGDPCFGMAEGSQADDAL